MGPADRHQAIVEHLDTVGVCTYQDLAKLLGVSEMTIRRDVDKLVKKRGLIKIFGGLQTAHAPENLYESPIQPRSPIHRAEKEQIARVAIQQIKPHQTIFLDGSTTCIVLARRIAKELRGLTVVTHSALVCLELGRTGVEYDFPPGGAVRSGQRVLRRADDRGIGPPVLRRCRLFLDERVSAGRRHVRVVARHDPHQADRCGAGRPRGFAGGPLEVRPACAVQGAGYRADPRSDHRCGRVGGRPGAGRSGMAWPSASGRETTRLWRL